MKFVADTNVLMQNPHLLDEYENIVILNSILRELDKRKITSDRERAYKARKASRYIEDNIDRITFDFKDYRVHDDRLDDCYEDNKIIAACIENGYKLLTYDRNMKHIAKGYGVEIVELDDKTVDVGDYTGYIEIYRTEDELTNIYTDLENNQWNLKIGQYLIIINADTKEEIDSLRWDGEKLLRSHSKGFSTNSFGKFRPMDFYQKSAVDSILNNQITMLKGRAGSGKSLISLYTAWNLIERGKFDQLIIFTNPVKTKNAEALGFYKGTRTEKLLDSQIGIMLASKFGDTFTIENEIHQGRLQLLPFSDIRGFDTSGEKKTIVWIVEAQNTNTELMKLALQRIGGNTKVIIDGDPKTQVDMSAYEYSNGMVRVSEVFKGTDLYGEVELKHIYRSRIAKIAEEM